MTVSKAHDGAGLWSQWVLANLTALEVAFLGNGASRRQLAIWPKPDRAGASGRRPVANSCSAGDFRSRLGAGSVADTAAAHPASWKMASRYNAPFLVVIALTFQLPGPHKLAQIESLAFAALNGSATGICIALSQVLVLWGRVAGTQVWLAAGLVGYGLGAVSTMALSIYVFLPLELDAAVTGGILGAVTGLAVLRFLGRASTPSAEPDMQIAGASSG